MVMARTVVAVLALALLAHAAGDDAEPEQLDAQAQAQLDALGPISLGKDGKMSRIANWHELTDGEKTAAINAIKKRNAKRKRKLLEAEQQQQTEKKKSRLRTFFAKIRSWLTNPYSPLWRRLRKVFSRQHKLPKEDA